MNPEAQRIAIATFCGWTGCSDAGCVWRKCQHLHKGPIVGFPEHYSTSRYPDYLNDLNAMFSAEHVMQEKDGNLCIDYVDFLRDIDAPATKSRYGLVHAPASQRAKALLKTIGKWTED